MVWIKQQHKKMCDHNNLILQIKEWILISYVTFFFFLQKGRVVDSLTVIVFLEVM